MSSGSVCENSVRSALAIMCEDSGEVRTKVNEMFLCYKSMKLPTMQVGVVVMEGRVFGNEVGKEVYREMCVIKKYG